MDNSEPRHRTRTPARLAALFAALSVAAAAPPAAADERTSSQRAPAPSPGVVNINTADAATLERLRGIGPAKAEAILEVRERRGRFRRVRQILFVHGIGRATFRRLRPVLTVEGETTLE